VISPFRLQETGKPFGMLLLVVCGFIKNRRYLLIPLPFGKIGCNTVTVARLRFPANAFSRFCSVFVPLMSGISSLLL
jgi:hypothetical protein